MATKEKKKTTKAKTTKAPKVKKAKAKVKEATTTTDDTGAVNISPTAAPACAPFRAASRALPTTQDDALDASEEQGSEVVPKKTPKTPKRTKSVKTTTKRKRWFEASEYMLRGRPEGVPKRKTAKKSKSKTSAKATKKSKPAAKKVSAMAAQSPHLCVCSCTKL